MQVPWSLQTVKKHRHMLDKIVASSYLPANMENAYTSNILTHIATTLDPTSKCQICNLLFSTVTNNTLKDTFFQNYAAICYFSMRAPICWTSTLVTIADMLELFANHFPGHNTLEDKIEKGEIMGIDFYMHFISRQCFKQVSEQELMNIENISHLKASILMGLLTNTSSQLNLCTQWYTVFNKHAIKDMSYLDHIENIPALSAETDSFTDHYKDDLLDVVMSAWKTSSLFHHTPDQPYHVELDYSQGPCLLSFPFSLKIKGNTFTVCLLCECLAAHPDAYNVLHQLKTTVLTCLENNSSLIDRTSYVLSILDTLPLSSNEKLCNLLKSRSINEVHKHLFCDPLCALNTLRTHVDVLFKYPNPDKYKILLHALSTGKYLSKNSKLDSEELGVLTLAFKACQISQFPKKFEIEVLKSITKLGNSLTSINPIHTFSTYT